MLNQFKLNFRNNPTAEEEFRTKVAHATCANMRRRAELRAAEERAAEEATRIAQAKLDSTANPPVRPDLLDEMLKTISAEAQASVPSGTPQPPPPQPPADQSATGESTAVLDPRLLSA